MPSKKPARLELLPDPTVKTEDWETSIRDRINHSVWFRNSFLNYGSNDIQKLEVQFDLERTLIKRRTKALINTREILVKRYGHDLPNWLGLNIESNSYSSLESSYHLLYAASVWILDSIMESIDEPLNYRELYELLPKDVRVLDELRQLNAWDSHFSQDLILSVEYVLRNRNRDIAPLENDGFGNYRVLTSILAANKQDHTIVPSKQNFNKLIALIPQEKIDHAIQSFMECFWSWVDNFFIVEKRLAAETNELRLKVNETRKQINQQRSKIEKMIEQSKREQRKKMSSTPKPKKPPIVSSTPFPPLLNYQHKQQPSLITSYLNTSNLYI